MTQSQTDAEAERKMEKMSSCTVVLPMTEQDETAGKRVNTR